MWLILVVPTTPGPMHFARGAHTWRAEHDPMFFTAPTADKALARYLGRAL